MDHLQSSPPQPDTEPPSSTRVRKPTEPYVDALLSPNAKYAVDVRTLRIAMDIVHDLNRGFELNASLQYVDYCPIDWDALLSLMVSVRRLEMVEMPLTSPHVVKIVEATSTHCSELEALVLPTELGLTGRSNEVQPLVSTVLEAAKRWRAREERPGLSELTMPCYARSTQASSSAELLRLVIAECPRLTALDIALCHADGINDGDDSSDTVDDAFYEMLSRSCSSLARFTLRDIISGRQRDISTTLTDDGLMALGRLPFLTDLELRWVNFTGLRLFDFLSQPPPDRNASRLFQITIGELHSTARLLEAFRVLMERLEATSCSDLRFATSNFLLRVNNGTNLGVDEPICSEYLRTVEPLVDRVKAKHPSLRIRLTMRGESEFPSAPVYHFWLYTTSTTRTPPQDLNWGVDPDPDNSFATLKGTPRRCISNGRIGGSG